jgi:hypothetical protein
LLKLFKQPSTRHWNVQCAHSSNILTLQIGQMTSFSCSFSASPLTSWSSWDPLLNSLISSSIDSYFASFAWVSSIAVEISSAEASSALKRFGLKKNLPASSCIEGFPCFSSSRSWKTLILEERKKKTIALSFVTFGEVLQCFL